MGDLLLMSQPELTRYDIVRQLQEHRLTQRAAAALLGSGRAPRQTTRQSFSL